MAADMFLKLDGISGESQDDKHKDEIEVESFSWGLSQAISRSAGAAAAGRPSFQDFTFTSRVSVASPRLMEACASGSHLKDAVLTVRRSGEIPVEYLQITLSDVVVSSYNEAGATESVPEESVSLNFAKIEYEYRPQDARGGNGAPVSAGWDLRGNTKR